MLTLIKNSFLRYKKHFFVFVVIELIPVLALLLFSYVGKYFVQWYAFTILGLITQLIYIIGQLALIFVVSSPDSIGVVQAYGKALKRFFSFAWTTLLNLAVIVSIIGVPFVLSLLWEVRGSSGTSLNSLPTFHVNYFLRFIYALTAVFAIFFSIRFIFSSYVLADQDIRGIRALLTSKAYTRGRVFAIIARIIVMGFILGMFSFVVSLLSTPFPAGVRNTISGVAGFLTAPYAVLYIHEMYLHEKHRSGAEVRVNAGRRFWFGLAVVLSLAVVALIIYALLNTPLFILLVYFFSQK